MIYRNIELPENISFFLFGPRQTGKTTLINHLYSEKVFKLNLLLNRDFLKYSKDPDILIKEVSRKIEDESINTLIIDEIQRVPALLNAVQFIIDQYRLVCVLTGSSARKLKKGAANLLGGRALQRFLFPFTWDEIEKIYSLEEVLTYGTLPHIVIAGKKLRYDLLNAYVETYIKEEIHAEGIIRNVGSFSRFLDMAAAQFTEQVNYSEIARECQLPVMTVKTYYEILEDTLIGIILHPYRKSVRKRLSAHPKAYFFDNGVTNAINKYSDDIHDASLAGKLFEQFIINETYRFLNYRQSNIQMFYWRTNTGAEVDLILVKNKIIIAAFEIKYSANIAGSHLSGLRSFAREHPEVPCFIISRASEPYSISQVEIIKWQDLSIILNKFV